MYPRALGHWWPVYHHTAQELEKSGPSVDAVEQMNESANTQHITEKEQ